MCQELSTKIRAVNKNLCIYLTSVLVLEMINEINKENIYSTRQIRAKK